MDLAGILLMGGQSIRMGEDKAHLMVDGRCFYQIIASELEQCAPVFLSIAKGKEDSVSSYPVISDTYEKAGPMGGITSALAKIPQEAAFFVPCDIPTLSADFMKAIIMSYDASYDGIIVSTESGKWYPTIGIYHKRLLPELTLCMERGHYKLVRFVEDANFQVVTPKALGFSEEILVNINTKEDFINYKNKTAVKSS